MHSFLSSLGSFKIISLLCLCSAFLSTPVYSLGGPTDTLTWGGDYSRSGYQTNHNLDPAIVGTANFGQIFRTTLPGNYNNIGPEQIFSQPLVLTSNDGVQYIFLATTQNNIYKINAKTGVIVFGRNMHVPFLTADLDGCVDINPTVGVTATGVIDPATGYWYLIAKTYADGFQNQTNSPSSPPGRLNGRQYFHAIDTQSATLADAFPPVLLDGLLFRNNPNRMFIGGNQHSRPALVIAANKYVYAGFASHCVKWNFTGAIVGFDKTNGKIVEALATEGGPEANTVPGGGVWMSGGGIAYDGSSLFFASGNGYASQLSNIPVPGRQPPSALEEAAVNAKVNTEDGTLSVIDFFMPYEKQALDGADKDLGTSPLELLPTDTFTCPNVKRMGVVTGKSGKTYVLNLDDLGGYQMGPNRGDNAVFVFQNENSVYAGAGVMPLGAYIYINIIKFRTRVFKFSCDASGNPAFTVAGYTPEANAAILGTGHGTTTSLGGKAGTGLVWISDVEGINLRIYKPDPDPASGNLTLVNGFNIPGVTKFTRPVFGNGRAYIGTTKGYLYGFGSPVNLPFNCSSSNQFDDTAIGSTSQPLTMSCKALIQVTILGFSIAGNPNFVISGTDGLANKTYAAGASISFQAIFKPQTVGPLSSDIIINSTSAATGYSSNTPVTLRGTAFSSSALLAVNPNTVSFTTIVNSSIGGVNQTSLFSNQGNKPLTVSRILFSQTSEQGPWVDPTNDGISQSVGPFTFYDLPSTIAANSFAAVTVNYIPSSPGNDAVFLNITSNGGSAILDVVAVAATNPVAIIEFERWDAPGQYTQLDPANPVFTFGNVTENQTRKLKFRVTNGGGNSTALLSITVSKPPYGVPGLIGAVNNVDLAEGTLLAAGESETATLFCSVPKSQVNTPGYSGSANWTMNTGDPVLGKLFMQFNCNAVAEQFGPVTNGVARYSYIGCYRDNTPGRQLAVQNYTDSTNNSPQRCITACAGAGYIFAGMQYRQECWCGNAIPLTKDLERDCNFACSGNDNFTCGGNGYAGGKSEMSLFADNTRFVQTNVTPPALAIPPSVLGYNYVGCYAEKNGKAMSAKSVVDKANMTVELCQAFCSTNKYAWFELKNTQECYCGASINAAYATLAADTGCNGVCKGNNSEYCGAGSYGQVYNLNGTRLNFTSSSSSSVATSTTSAPISTSAGVNATTTSSVSITSSVLVVSSSTSISTASNGTTSASATQSVNATSSASSTSSSLSSSITAASITSTSSVTDASTAASPSSTVTTISPTTLSSSTSSLSPISSSTSATTSSSTASSTASGTSSTSSNPPVSPSVSASPSSSTVTTTSTTSTSSGTPTPSAVPSTGSYNYQGCYNETSGLTFATGKYTNNSMTVEMCAAFCTKYAWFGVEYGTQCYCGAYPRAGSGLVAATQCNMVCGGNKAQYCGAGNRLNAYFSNDTAKISADPSSPATVNGYNFYGCVVDNPKMLQYKSTATDMTVEKCMGLAQASGYTYAGLEYGSECWMGSKLLSALTNATAASQCSMTCAGNAAQLCGASNRLSLYSSVAITSK